MLLDKRSDMVDNKDRLTELLAGAISIFDASGTAFVKRPNMRVDYQFITPLSVEESIANLEQEIQTIQAAAFDFEMALTRAQSE